MSAKRMMVLILCLMILLTAVIPVTALAATNGWVKENGIWYYYVNGVRKTGWLKDGNFWYYLDPGNSGAMVKEWKQVSGEWYYLRPVDEGVSPNKKPEGSMVTAWRSIKGKWYYFHSSGAMTTGWTVNIWQEDGKVHCDYFNASGAWDATRGGFIVGATTATESVANSVEASKNSYNKMSNTELQQRSVELNNVRAQVQRLYSDWSTVLPIASSMLQRFYARSGPLFYFDVSLFMTSSLQDRNIKDALYAKIAGFPNSSYVLNSEGYSGQTASTANYLLAIGKYNSYFQVTGGAKKYFVRDNYDWAPGGSIYIYTGVTEEQLHALHRAGLALEYEVQGSSTY